MKCPRCQYENPLGSNFCLGCGTRLGATCGACGNDLPAGSRFCNKCGTPVSGEPATQEGRFASPESYTPQHLAERILTSKSALEGSVGDAYDNALCESFFATLECELLDRQRFPTQADARLAVFDFIEGWYNPRRRHSALDYLSPMMFERTHSISDRTVTSGATIDQGGATLLSPSGAVQ